MQSRWLVLLALIAGIGAHPAFASRYAPSADGTEVTDAQTGLIWRRCTEGMVWDGQTCTGTPLNIVHSSAEALAKREAKASKKAWRLPSIKELKSLQVPDRPGELVEPAAFPGTPEMWFWSVFIDKPGVIDAFNLYFGYHTAKLGDGRDNPYGAVRLVRSGHPPRAKRK